MQFIILAFFIILGLFLISSKSSSTTKKSYNVISEARQWLYRRENEIEEEEKARLKNLIDEAEMYGNNSNMNSTFWLSRKNAIGNAEQSRYELSRYLTELKNKYDQHNNYDTNRDMQ